MRVHEVRGTAYLGAVLVLGQLARGRANRLAGGPDYALGDLLGHWLGLVRHL